VLKIHGKALPVTPHGPVEYELFVIDPASFFFPYLASSTNVGSAESLTVRVKPGVSYFLAVVDAAAEQTRYSLCMRKGLPGISCVPPGAALQASIAPSVYRIRQRSSSTLPPSLRLSPLREFIKRP